MSFKNKMKNRGISKLDNLVETPDYITPVVKPKPNFNWLKIAIPVTAGLALIVVPVSILAANGVFVSNMSNKSAAPGDSGYAPTGDPNYGYDDSEMYGGGSSSEGEPAPEGNKGESTTDMSFTNLLNKYHIFSNIVIEVYDYADGYMSPTYSFTDNEASNIIKSLREIPSDYNDYLSKISSDTANRNSFGNLMGINHRLIFKEMPYQMIANYYSQFGVLVIDSSAFYLSGSDAYSIMDLHVEMDYDPTFDETINL